MIYGIGQAGPARAARRVDANRGAGFQVPDGPEPASGLAALAKATPALLGGLLGLQELDDARKRDQKARRHGADLLALLTELQVALTGDGDLSDRLTRLQEMARAAPQAAEPGLRAILGAISLRARIELARGFRQKTPAGRAGPG